MRARQWDLQACERTCVCVRICLLARASTPSHCPPAPASRWAQSMGYSVRTIERTAGEEAGVKSVALEVDGGFA